MKKLVLSLCLLFVPAVLCAQVPYDVLTYQPGVIIPAGDVSTPPAPLQPPHDGWYALTINVPPESLGVQVGFNSLTWAPDITVEMFLYSYDFQGAFLQSIGKTTQLVPNRHFNGLGLSFSNPNLRPTTLVLYVRAASELTSNLWVLSFK